MASNKTIPPRQLYELKKKAQQYYADNGVPQKMEAILNSMFYANPPDVYGHLANYFEGFASKPKISRVAGRTVLDSKGQLTLQAEVYCTIKNNEKLVSTAVCSSENYYGEHSRMEDRDGEEEDRRRGVMAALDLISGSMGQNTAGLDPTDQQTVDKAIMSVIRNLMEEEAARDAQSQAQNARQDVVSPIPHQESPNAKHGKAKSPKGKNKNVVVFVIPDEPREKLIEGCNSVCVLSQAMCMAGAQVAGLELYQHIANISSALTAKPRESKKLQMPASLITLLSAGKAGAGKMKAIKEYMIIPRHDMSVAEVIEHTSSIFNILSKNTMGKPGQISIRCTNDTGALCPVLDRLEQGLDLITDAITQAGLTAGQDFFFALNCAGHETFDFEKGKYEVIIGQQKDGEGLVDMWADLVHRYPAVVALVDPMRKQDKSAWTQLCEKISEKCLIIGDHIYHRPGLLKDEDLSDEVGTSGVIMRLEQMTSITDLLAAANKMQENNNYVVLSTSTGETPDTTLVDLAVGSGIRFIKMGAPCRGERIAKLNRLVQIEAQLKSSEKLGKPEPLTFPNLTPPPPVAEEGTAQNEESSEQ